MVADAICKKCGNAMFYSEFGLSRSDGRKILQEFHDAYAHMSKEEQLKCDSCGHQSKDVDEALKHYGKCPVMVKA